MITVPMIVFTSAKIAPTASSVSTSCSISPGGNGVMSTVSTEISETTQSEKALMTTRMMKRIVPPVCHAPLGFLSLSTVPEPVEGPRPEPRLIP